jgi:hypothetical protein
MALERCAQTGKAARRLSGALRCRPNGNIWKRLLTVRYARRVLSEPGWLGDRRLLPVRGCLAAVRWSSCPINEKANNEEQYDRYNQRWGDDEGQETLLTVGVRNTVSQSVDKDEEAEERHANDCCGGAPPFAPCGRAAPILTVAHRLKLNDRQVLGKRLMFANGKLWKRLTPGGFRFAICRSAANYLR